WARQGGRAKPAAPVLSLQSIGCRRSPLYSLLHLGARFLPLSVQKFASPSRSAFCGRRGPPSQRHSNGSETLASPACCASPNHARVQYVHRLLAALETNAAPILPGIGASGWAAHARARCPDRESSSRYWAPPRTRLP